jgi:hypothetical protein
MRFLLLAFAVFNIALVECSRLEASASQATSLAQKLTALSPTVDAQEARRVAECSYKTAARLQREYRVVRPALLQNVLVNTGLRKRGLCFHWTEDLLGSLQRLKLRTLQLRWGVARAGTWREHNCVVVTARRQIFAQGVVLDSWRYGGRLFWGRVATDHYPWREDGSEYARAKLAATIAVR